MNTEMAMNKVRGNMYDFCTHTWNTILGKCHHNCSYCYNIGRPFFEGELRLNEKNLKDNLGEGNFIFVGSSNDLFQDDIPEEWIIKTVEHCRKYPKNKYLFQSKNPCRMYKIFRKIPKMDNVVFGTTIETNSKELSLRHSDAPTTEKRAWWIQQLNSNEIMVTIEPIMQFDLDILIKWLRHIKPKWINIGADSKRHNLLEPKKEEIEELIKELNKFTEVKIKPNLSRLLNEVVK